MLFNKKFDPERCALNRNSEMSLYSVAVDFVGVLVNWFWTVVGGSMFHKGLVRILYFPSILRMSLLEGPKRRWYDRVDSTVIVGALPFRSQTKEVGFAIPIWPCV